MGGSGEEKQLNKRNIILGIVINIIKKNKTLQGIEIKEQVILLDILVSLN